MIIEIPGAPIAWQRAGKGKKGFFDAQYKAKQNLQWYFKEKYPDQKVLDKPISMTVTFYMPIPKSLSNKKKISLVDCPHTKKKDLSNMVKFYEDCFNGIIWVDDCLIWEEHLIKIWAEEGKTIFEIEVLDD